MAAANLDTVNLAAVVAGGQLNEDVMQKIHDISPIDLPFSDMIGRSKGKQPYISWVEKALAAAAADNVVIEGADAGTTDTTTGRRVGTYHQLSDKVLRMADRSRYSDTIGTGDELAYQLMERQQELRRDVEARISSTLPAVAGNGSDEGDETAGIGAWIASDSSTNNSDRGATGADPALSGTTGGYPDTEQTDGTARTLTETILKSMIQAAYNNGGNLTHAMGRPVVIGLISDYLFSSSARIATLQSQVAQSNRTMASSGNGAQGGGIVAQGAVNIYVTNFGTVILTPNRFQPQTDTDASSLYLIDKSLWKLSFLRGYTTDELAKTGSADNRQITVDFALISMNEEGNAVIADIDETAAMTT